MHSKFIRSVLASASVFLSVSCTHQNYRVYRDEAFDRTLATIQISPGTDSFGMLMKYYFRKKGFVIFALDGSSSGARDNDHRVDSKAPTAYRLLYSSSPIPSQVCSKQHYMASYSYSILNLRTGREVISMSGTECTDKLLERLDSLLGYSASTPANNSEQ